VRESRVLYWVDPGTSAAMGQFILVQPRNAVNRNKKSRLPTVAEPYQENIGSDEKHQREPACSAAAALTRTFRFKISNLSLSFRIRTGMPQLQSA